MEFSFKSIIFLFLTQSDAAHLKSSCFNLTDVIMGHEFATRKAIPQGQTQSLLGGGLKLNKFILQFSESGNIDINVLDKY